MSGSFTVKPLLARPELITTIDTGYEMNRVTCLGDKHIWTCGEDKVMKLYNLRGRVLQSFKTELGDFPGDIAVTRSGNLLYTDPESKTINVVANQRKKESKEFQMWKPYSICSTSSGDLLVYMISDFHKQSKVVRYSDSFIEKQLIQFDEKGKPLFSLGFIKYISENRNLDICVADNGASTVVVINRAAKLKFRYSGCYSASKKSFDPYGITIDSQSQILIADCYNNCIHILDQGG
ncbi:uncharacterized protein LOC134232745 [Saccostrea cucullata]|uniref:uncharacterized protein LOC134232745 n=1 Tax=Saccostrea cuccullata TaxID=36930 RepID=UPI002ED2F901